MYYLLKTYEMRNLGSGSIIRHKLINKSPLKENLISLLADKFLEAMDDNQVEFINMYEKDEEDAYELDDIKNDIEDGYINSFETFINLYDELWIQYYSDGFDNESVTYVILDDEETELII